MTEPMRKLPKPLFADLLASYQPDPTSVHECKRVDPTESALHSSAARLSEALALADKIVASRAEIAALGTGQGDGTQYVLGPYGYGRFGRLCPHGIGRGAHDVAEFLAHHWGARTTGWTAQASAPDAILGKTGVVAFLRIPGLSGQGHIDLWNKTGSVGHEHWGSETIWFWQLA
jgi:hypothetical protein